MLFFSILVLFRANIQRLLYCPLSFSFQPHFTFTPKHGSWLNLVEGFFSKFARSVLRHIRVTSKHELKERIMAGIADVNRHPVIHTWTYKLAEACLI